MYRTVLLDWVKMIHDRTGQVERDIDRASGGDVDGLSAEKKGSNLIAFTAYNGNIFFSIILSQNYLTSYDSAGTFQIWQLQTC